MWIKFRRRIWPQIRKNPASRPGLIRDEKTAVRAALLSAQRLDAAREARDLPRRGILVHDALLGGAHHLRLGGAQGGCSLGLVAGSNGLFNLADKSPHAAATRLVDRGALRDLAGHLLGGHGVGHGPS